MAACHSGLAGGGNTEVAGFAQQLLRKGVPQVLAMQSKVSDRYATALAGAFYHELASNTNSASLALARARVELERERRAAAGRGESTPPPEFATPSLFRAGVEQPLVDLVSVPVAPLEFEGTLRSGAVPMLPVGDLIGRRKELRELMWVLRGDRKRGLGRKAGAQLIGMVGVGKSSLAGRAMQRLRDDGWTVFAHSGRWKLGSLAENIGKAVKSQELIAASNDNDRIELIGQLLANQRFLLVLDNFEDNLTADGGAFLDGFSAGVLRTLCERASIGKLLITTRYPLPAMAAWLATFHIGALSHAQYRKLILRLESLRSQDHESLKLIHRTIGGHPRMLEYLDAILRGGEARIPVVGEKLLESADRIGIDLEDQPKDLEDAIKRAVDVGVEDILLDQLLVIAGADDRAVLHQAAVFPVAVPPEGIAFCLSGAEAPSTDQVSDARAALRRLTKLSLVTPIDGEYWVHRWTAEARASETRLDSAELRECNRLAGEYFDWRVETEERRLDWGLEAARLFLKAMAYDRAAAVAMSAQATLRDYGRSLDNLAFCQEICQTLPEEHDRYYSFLGEQIDAYIRLGAGDEALTVTKQLIRTLEARTQAEPGRADYQRNLSVTYVKMGDLLKALGQGDEARRNYELAVDIRERLAEAEPGRLPARPLRLVQQDGRSAPGCGAGRRGLPQLPTRARHSRTAGGGRAGPG